MSEKWGVFCLSRNRVVAQKGTRGGGGGKTVRTDLSKNGIGSNFALSGEKAKMVGR